MKPILRISAVISALSLAACMEPAKPTEVSGKPAPKVTVQTPTVAGANPTVTSRFGGGSLSWTGAGDLKYRYNVIERDGEMWVCGAYTGRGSPKIRKLSREVLRQATVAVAGDTVMRNLSYFSEASNANWDVDLVGVATKCKSSGIAAGGASVRDFSVEMRSGKYRVRL